MPFCHRHGVPMLVDVYGTATCERCEAERRVEFAHRCRTCLAPVTEPGLCPSCESVARRERGVYWLADHAVWIAILVLLIGLAVLGPALSSTFRNAFETGQKTYTPP